MIRRFSQERKCSTTVEFAIVGSLYFLVLLFAVEGGILYLKIDTLDLATERASRLLVLNNVATAPATSAAFIGDIAANSNGALQTANIAISVQMAAAVTGTIAAPKGGFQSLSTTFTAKTFQYVPGSCPVTTIVGSTPTVGACTGGCAYSTAANATNIPGELDPGYQTTVINANNSTTTTLHQTYTCSAGQDILVQVQYTDTTLTKLVAGLFGPIITTLAFQAEPTLS
jgi:hypothetical protein